MAETFHYGTPSRVDQLQYTDGAVRLKPIPNSQRTWNTWIVGIGAERTFPLNYQFVELAFGVQESGSEISKGLLELVSTSQPMNSLPTMVLPEPLLLYRTKHIVKYQRIANCLTPKPRVFQYSAKINRQDSTTRALHPRSKIVLLSSCKTYKSFLSACYLPAHSICKYSEQMYLSASPLMVGHYQDSMQGNVL